ncbi:hypothetical protein GPNCGGLF_LOCUS529 [Methylorubrum aminovorans]
MSMTAPDDVVQQIWRGLAQSSVFRFGQIRMREHGLHCPRRDALVIHPAEGRVEEIGEYAGEIGTLN